MQWTDDGAFEDVGVVSVSESGTGIELSTGWYLHLREEGRGKVKAGMTLRLFGPNPVRGMAIVYRSEDDSDRVELLYYQAEEEYRAEIRKSFKDQEEAREREIQEQVAQGKKRVTEKDTDEIASWFKEAREVKDIAQLGAFITRLMDWAYGSYVHDYGSVCHAVAACAVAAAWCANAQDQGGITGFQAGFVNFLFLEHWGGIKPPCRIVQYEHMLYPQYRDRFEKVISANTWKMLQDKAKELIEKDDVVDRSVLAHWKSIVSGKVPFGYRIEEDR